MRAHICTTPSESSKLIYFKRDSHVGDFKHLSSTCYNNISHSQFKPKHFYRNIKWLVICKYNFQWVNSVQQRHIKSHFNAISNNVFVPIDEGAADVRLSASHFTWPSAHSYCLWILFEKKISPLFSSCLLFYFAHNFDIFLRCRGKQFESVFSVYIISSDLISKYQNSWTIEASIMHASLSLYVFFFFLLLFGSTKFCFPFGNGILSMCYKSSIKWFNFMWVRRQSFNFYLKIHSNRVVSF